jgi:cob(I)alamin adenosyltransferase
VRIYTRTGDTGETGLYVPKGAARRVGKDDLRVEAYGTVDELNSWLGLLAVRLPWERAFLHEVQRVLFQVGYDLSTPTDPPPTTVQPADVKALEDAIDRLSAALPPLRSFLLPGGSEGTAFTHVARTVCRRAERRIVALGRQTPLNPELGRYMNRLSDYLFTLARSVAAAEGADEVPMVWRT